MPDAEAARRAIAEIWKDESARIVGYLTRVVRDISLAEELAQDALVAALEDWPRAGLPDRPGAWLMTTAKNRAINWLRRAQLAARVGDALGDELGASATETLEDEIV